MQVVGFLLVLLALRSLDSELIYIQVVELGVQGENQQPVCISTHYLMTVELGVQGENQRPVCISTHYLMTVELGVQGENQQHSELIYLQVAGFLLVLLALRS
jgi:hypothetical protein